MVLRPQPAQEFHLRAIGPGDLELLRVWKNLHRRSFFHQDIISPQAQEAWFAGYLTRPQDWMFLVKAEGRPGGVLGWREWQGRADIYNVMRGETAWGGRGLMSRALGLMLSHLLAEGRDDIVARVVKGNPALAWYQHNGFVLEQDRDDHLLVRLDLASFTPSPFTLGKGD
jgi:RimJ/RimL family protein N-acetyltransferase